MRSNTLPIKIDTIHSHITYHTSPHKWFQKSVILPCRIQQTLLTQTEFNSFNLLSVLNILFQFQNRGIYFMQPELFIHMMKEATLNLNLQNMTSINTSIFDPNLQKLLAKPFLYKTCIRNPLQSWPRVFNVDQYIHAVAASTFCQFHSACPCRTCTINGWQLAKMKKSIPDMSLSWNL